MSSGPKLTTDPLEELKAILGAAPRGYVFLDEYIEELEHHRLEEDTFIRLAFQNAEPGGPYSPGGRFITSVYSEMYEPLSAEQKTAIRRWWHANVRREAEAFTGLRERLNKLP